MRSENPTAMCDSQSLSLTPEPEEQEIVQVALVSGGRPLRRRAWATADRVRTGRLPSLPRFTECPDAHPDETQLRKSPGSKGLAAPTAKDIGGWLTAWPMRDPTDALDRAWVHGQE